MTINLNLRCKYPGCESTATGGQINGASVCVTHIDWAMGQPFKPIETLQDVLADALKRDEDSL